MQKIEGKEFGTYVVTAIQLGLSKSAGINANGKPSRYIVLFVKNVKMRLGRPRHIVMFEEEVPGLFEILKNYTVSDTPENGRYTVDLIAFKKSEDVAAMDGLLEFPGMTTEQYKLRKGLCYQNDIDGKRVYFGKDGDANREPVMRDTISVLVRVDNAIEANGVFKMNYFDKWSPEDQGARMESTFYREAVNANTPSVPEPEPVEEDDAADTNAPF
jgi:hypothetical protein